MGKSHNRLFELAPQRTPRFEVALPKDYDSKKPIFSFMHMQYNKEHCLSRCNQEDKAAIVGKLLRLSQFTWKQIISQPRDALGFEHIPVGRFTATLPPYVTPDVSKLMVFRYSDAGRMAGTRSEDILHILLVGDNLYPH
jgi:hypothetical protein